MKFTPNPIRITLSDRPRRRATEASNAGIWLLFGRN